MQVIHELLHSLTLDRPVSSVCIGPHLIAVESQRLGLASNLHDPGDSSQATTASELETLVGRGAQELAAWLLQDRWLEASLGMAALNSLLPVDLDTLVDMNAREIIIARARGRDLAVVGHFPFVEKLRPLVRKLWVIEKHPRPGDLSEEEGYEMLWKADVVAITGTCLINHTFQRVMTSCRPRSFKIMLGPSTPLSPLLFNFGLDSVCGTLVEDERTVLAMVGEGASFRELRGIRTVALFAEQEAHGA